jgi:hypothetical protein
VRFNWFAIAKRLVLRYIRSVYAGRFAQSDERSENYDQRSKQLCFVSTLKFLPIFNTLERFLNGRYGYDILLDENLKVLIKIVNYA